MAPHHTPTGIPSSGNRSPEWLFDTIMEPIDLRLTTKQVAQGADAPIPPEQADALLKEYQRAFTTFDAIYPDVLANLRERTEALNRDDRGDIAGNRGEQPSVPVSDDAPEELRQRLSDAQDVQQPIAFAQAAMEFRLHRIANAQGYQDAPSHVLHSVSSIVRQRLQPLTRPEFAE